MDKEPAPADARGDAGAGGRAALSDGAGDAGDERRAGGDDGGEGGITPSVTTLSCQPSAFSSSESATSGDDFKRPSEREVYFS